MDQEHRLLAVSIQLGPRVQIGVPQVLFTAGPTVANVGAYPYDVTPDGQRFIFTRRLEAEAPPSLIVANGWLR